MQIPRARAFKWLAVVTAASVLAACALPGERARPGPGEQVEYKVPPEAVPPLGQCRIWYEVLPPHWQPPAMPCARAHALAAKHGGKVLKSISPRASREGRALAIDYGESDFGDLAPEQLPPPGYCRPWLSRTPAEKQPAPMTCERAELLVRQYGGKVIYMPGPEAP